MRLVWVAAGVIVLAGFGYLIANRQHENTNNVQGTRAAQQPETFAEIQANVRGGAALIDVRTIDEYSAGHFEGARNLSLQDIQAGTLPNVAKDTVIYVYCHSGNRSKQSAQLLREAGYRNVVDLGGVSNVESRGGKIVW